MTNTLEAKIPLGKETIYESKYNPKLLFPIPRAANRLKIGIKSDLPFYGLDIWNAYELSWLNKKGLPQVAIAVFYIPCDSENIIESKSFKLYLNSFNQTEFSSALEIEDTLIRDLSQAANTDVLVQVENIDEYDPNMTNDLEGQCIDQQDIKIDKYQVDESFLTCDDDIVEEILYSRLLKSNCPVTNQPDWATVFIKYKGKKINQAGLLKYICSFRDHNDFHENCIEQIYLAIMQQTTPEKLSVYGRFLRRGGLDINPFRSNFESLPENNREVRQ